MIVLVGSMEKAGAKRWLGHRDLADLSNVQMMGACWREGSGSRNFS